MLNLVGGKFIIVEDGKPKAVLMSYEEFSDLAVPEVARRLTRVLSEAEEINKEVTKAQLVDWQDETPQSLETAGPEEIKIEPLD